MIVENNEIFLRNWNVEDAPEAYEFYGDAEVSKYIGDGKPAQDIAQVERILIMLIKHQNEHGFAPWAIIEKKSNLMVGICGLHKFNAQKETELGFRISRSRWGQGFATSASLLSIQYGFDVLKLSSLAALTSSDNLVTQKVLEKVGFNFIREILQTENESPLFRYELQSHKIG